MRLYYKGQRRGRMRRLIRRTRRGRLFGKRRATRSSFRKHRGNRLKHF